MKIETVGILSPGDMGQAMGEVLKGHGLRVVAALTGRSPRTRGLAEQVGIEDVGDLEGLVRESDVLCSVLVPGAAVTVAGEVAAALKATGAELLYVDCNAIAPATTRQVGEIVRAAGARYVDGSIIGPPPRGGAKTRFYASGEHAADFARLGESGLDVRVLGEEIGLASGLKVCYAGLTKGLAALATELLIAARRMNLSEPLRAELEGSQSALYGWISSFVPRMPPKAHRWISEMDEIAAAYQHLGLTPRIHQGAADMFRFVAQTPLAQESPETRDRSRDLDSVIEALAAQPVTK